MKCPVVVPSVLALVVLLAACSDHSPVAPGAYSRIPCRPPVELAAMVVGTPFEPNAMRTALQQAGNNIGPTLGDGADVRALRAKLPTGDGDRDDRARCTHARCAGLPRRDGRFLALDAHRIWTGG